MPEQTSTTPVEQTGREDSFFVLRDCREFFEGRLVDIAKQTGISSPSVIEAFAREIGDAYDELATATRQDGFEQTAGLTASRISLVGNDDLELEIRINDIANRLRDNEHIEHWRAQSRYMTLLNRPQMNVDNSPVGLEPIRRGLWVLCKEGGENLEKTLARLDRLEEQLQLCLPDVYKELNEILRRHDIAPTAPKIVQREGSGNTPISQAAGGTIENQSTRNSVANTGTPGNNAFAALQQAVKNQFAANELFPPELTPGVFAENTSRQAPAGAGTNFTLDASSVVMLNQLMERLRVLELQQMTGLSNFSLGETGSESGNEAPLHVLKSKDLDLPLGTPASIALDTLSLIFEAIFAAPNLPEVIKTGIGRLQIPLLKLAMLDASFFADTQHPARLLINRLAQAAMGLAQECGRDHPLCAKLLKLADTARTTLESGNGDLTQLLSELDTLINERNERLQAGSQLYVQLLRKHEAQQAAQAAAQNWLKQTLSTTTEPEIRRFLSDYWVRVMQDAFFDSGKDGALAKEYEITVKELLWSIEPKQTPDERKKLLALIPALLKRINAGLDSVKVSSEQRKPFLDACFELQTASLRNRPGAPDSQQPQTPEPIAAESIKTNLPSEAHLLEENGKLVQYLGQATGAYISRRTENAAWKDGDWISFALPDEERLCGRVCWQGAPFGTVLLFNTEWGFAVALAPAMLEQQLRNAKALIASESALFDDAAKSALSQIAPF